MLLAEKFGMYYIDKDGQKKLPYIIHRTSLGCFERTLAYMLEHFNGVLPLANNCYVCGVTATTDTYTYGKGEVTDIIPLSVIVYDDGSTTLAFKVN